MSDVRIFTLADIPLIEPGDDLCAIIVAAIERAGLEFVDGDVLVVAQKIVSKSEGRMTALAAVTPGAQAVALAQETDKDPRLVQLVLDESSEVLRHKPGVIIVRHRLGHVGANAGIDQSNIEHAAGETALLLPVDPDRSARQLHDGIRSASARHVGIVIADSMNRPWRLGTIGGAIGCAGVRVLDDLRGGRDMFGRELKVAMVNRADSIAAMAAMLMGESVERTPVALVRGLPPDTDFGTAADIMRPLEDDLFS